MGADARKDGRPFSVHTSDHAVLCDMGRVGAICPLHSHQVGAAETGSQDGEACQALPVTANDVMSCHMSLSSTHVAYMFFCIVVLWTECTHIHQVRVPRDKDPSDLVFRAN